MAEKWKLQVFFLPQMDLESYYQPFRLYILYFRKILSGRQCQILKHLVNYSNWQHEFSTMSWKPQFSTFSDYVAVLIIDFMISPWHIHIKARLIKMLKVRHIFKMTKENFLCYEKDVHIFFTCENFIFFCLIQQIYDHQNFSRFTFFKWKLLFITIIVQKFWIIPKNALLS